MCGIAGFTTYNKEFTHTESKTFLTNMCDKIIHRGPDDVGYYHKDFMHLGHRRLSIIDVSFGAQPITSSCGNYTIVYNGELYNTKELRLSLIKKGYVFKTKTDTEVILNTYIEYKEKAPEKLNGIFAFVISDIRKNRLFLCRDRFGVKPLYYTTSGKDIIFASEIKALQSHPAISLEINDDSLREVFGTFPSRSEGNGVYKNIKEIGYGEYAYFSDFGFISYKYYELKATKNTYSYKEARDLTRFLVKDSILRQMVSDVSLSTFLSGGVDSSIITAIASNELERKGEKLSTISFDYVDNSKYFKSNSFQVDEDKHWVKKMIDIHKTNHTFLFLDKNELVDSLDEALDSKDYPGMTDIDGSLLRFCREVSKEHKVVLSGECADEIFGGYPWFKDPTILNDGVFPWIRNIDFRENLLNDSIAKKLQIKDYIQSQFEDTMKKVPSLYGEDISAIRHREMSYLNIKWFMTTLLERMDRMSMYNGLEVRVPYADHRIVDLVYNLPWEYINHLGTKGILRDAFTDTLPYELLFRKKSPYPKTYNPHYENLLCQKLKTILEDNNAPLNEYINKENVLKLIESPKDYGKPWFGQLMAGPQLLAYYIQVNSWLKSHL